jgi:fructokinase
MRKIIGIGETIIDIIFKDGQPVSAKPGGSAFNTLISIGRLNTLGIFISETGNDQLGESIKKCLVENNLSTDYINQFPDGKSPIALAFLNDENNAEYLFYKDYPKQRLDVCFPAINEDDILIFGSFFALNNILRSKVKKLARNAITNKAIVYYDPNFRKTHTHELSTLMPLIEENFSFSDIVRGSDEDFFNIFGENNIDIIYSKVVDFCPNFICTAAEKGVYLRTKKISKLYPTPCIKTVSTVGAGDSFNAGILYGLMKFNINKTELASLSEEKWDLLINYGILFSTNVCQSYENYISTEFANSIVNQQ